MAYLKCMPLVQNIKDQGFNNNNKKKKNQIVPCLPALPYPLEIKLIENMAYFSNMRISRMGCGPLVFYQVGGTTGKTGH